MSCLHHRLHPAQINICGMWLLVLFSLSGYGFCSFSSSAYSMDSINLKLFWGHRTRSFILKRYKKIISKIMASFVPRSHCHDFRGNLCNISIKKSVLVIFFRILCSESKCWRKVNKIIFVPLLGMWCWIWSFTCEGRDSSKLTGSQWSSWTLRWISLTSCVRTCETV